MASTSSSEAALKLEIARLTGAINRAKSATTSTSFNVPRRSNTYVNPNYKPSSSTTRPPQLPAPPSKIIATEPREVVIGGIAFESSGRSLVRKDAVASKSNSSSIHTQRRPRSAYPHGGTAASGRMYKPKTSSRGRRGGPTNRNMTLQNNQRPYKSVWSQDENDVNYLIQINSSRRLANKRAKHTDKPCPRFTTTGSCSRGLTCIYQHDPSKIAICWKFLQGNCPNTAESCSLSHDPTPERTPLCMHFANNGRCNRENCPFPHVRVGARQGICRDFAVLGYCEKGLDCDKQHVRECPDFSETGNCTIKGCKLPHVIRANRNRKPTTRTSPGPTTTDAPLPSSTLIPESASDPNDPNDWVSAEDAQLGDEYISLTFHESESNDSDSEESDEDLNEEDALEDESIA